MGRRAAGLAAEPVFRAVFSTLGTMQSLWMVVASLLFACMGVCVKAGRPDPPAVEIVFTAVSSRC